MAADADACDQTVERWYDAYDRRDVDDLCALVTPDVEIAAAGPRAGRLPGKSYHGRKDVRALMEYARSRWPHARVASVVTRPLSPWTLAHTTYRTADPALPLTLSETHTLFNVRHERISRILSLVLESASFPGPDPRVLTARERDVLKLLSDGLNAPQIAAELFVSPATVRTHVRNAMVRLGARTRVEAVALALRRGEIQL